MARNQGRHRIARRTKIATGALGLAIATGALVVTTTTGETGKAVAEADPSRYVDITTVQPNVEEPQPGENASTGTFTVNCGTNEEGHFNADNVIVAPGTPNAAEHVHSYVGNLETTNASSNESLAAADTTCANGDQSTYYWPVLRDTSNAQEVNQAENRRFDGGGQQSGSTAGGQEIECPDVAGRLPTVPSQAQAEVDRELANLDSQVDQANQRLQATRGEGGPNFAQNAILGPLRSKRAATIDRIAIAMGRVDQRPTGMDGLAECSMQDGGNDDQDGGGDNGDNGGNDGGDDGQGDGSQDEELPSPEGENLELPGNEGEILPEPSVDITFRGNVASDVTAMPQFMRAFTGQAKPSENGTDLARPSFTCTGFEDRLVDSYVICPEGSQVMRMHDFPGCWDGQNIDSENHRDHTAFADEQTGECPEGFSAIPQLRITLTYDIPRELQLAGEYELDSFPQEGNNPQSDHNDFINVMNEDIMNRVVNCINGGETCNE